MKDDVSEIDQIRSGFEQLYIGMSQDDVFVILNQTPDITSPSMFWDWRGGDDTQWVSLNFHQGELTSFWQLGLFYELPNKEAYFGKTEIAQISHGMALDDFLKIMKQNPIFLRHHLVDENEFINVQWVSQPYFNLELLLKNGYVMDISSNYERPGEIFSSIFDQLHLGMSQIEAISIIGREADGIMYSSEIFST